MSDIVKFEPGTIAVGAQWKQATDVAGAVREFALKRVLSIQGKKYPPVEVWQAVSNAFGCVASSRDVKRIEGGFSAIGEVRRMSDGAVIAEAEGFLGDDEATWNKRPVFARRAMAQTRAISRACRSAFAFVIPLIDSDLQTTPAEEMEAMGQAAQPTVITGSRTAELKSKLAARVARPPEMPQDPDPPPEAFEPETGEVIEPDPSAVIPFGKNKGKALSELTDKSFLWYLEKARESVHDPKWGEKNQPWLATCETEAKRRGL